MLSLVRRDAFGAEGAVLAEDHDLCDGRPELHHLPSFLLGLILELVTQLGGIFGQFNELISPFSICSLLLGITSRVRIELLRIFDSHSLVNVSELLLARSHLELAQRILLL